MGESRKVIGTRAELDKVNVSETVVGQTKVPAVTTVRNLKGA